MSALFVVRGGRGFSDEALDEPGAKSPPRPTVGRADRFNQDQFGDVMAASPEAPKKARHPHYVGKRSLHEYRTSPGSSQ
jgi:hypothetical protein